MFLNEVKSFATLENLNLYVSDLAWSVYHVEVNLAEFSLEYPITITDLTEKREIFIDCWNLFHKDCGDVYKIGKDVANFFAGSMAQGDSRFTSRMIGFIPVDGDIISFAIDMGTDYMAEKAEAEQNLSDALATLDAVRLSAYCTDLHLTTVIVSDGTAAQQLMIYPGPSTLRILQNINEYIEDHEGITLPGSLDDVLTTDDVLNNPGAVEILLYNMSDNDRRSVLEQWP
jgi:hypothetical protein